MKNSTHLAGTLLLVTASAIASDNTLENLCKQSTHGQQQCLVNLSSFIKTTGNDPLSDDEIYTVFGCIRPTEYEKNHGYKQDILGCKQIHNW